MTDAEILRVVADAAAAPWHPLPPGTKGDPNTIDVLWLAHGLEEEVDVRYPKSLPEKAMGIAIVELVEGFIQGTLIRYLPPAELAVRALDLSKRLQALAVLDNPPLTNLAIAFSVWHGCIGMAKSLRQETSNGDAYNPVMRASGYQVVKRDWESEERHGNPWVRYGVSLARVLEKKRGNNVVEDWVPKGSPYWS